MIKVGTTLTFDNEADSMENEPNAAMPAERIETLKILKENGIKTWVSIEPVINPIQSLNLINQSIGVTDHYKIGKLNHDPEAESKINWVAFLDGAVKMLRSFNKKFYIKADLLKFKRDDFELMPEETDMNYLNLK